MRKLFKAIKNLIPKKYFKKLNKEYYLTITLTVKREIDNNMIYSKDLDLFNND